MKNIKQAFAIFLLVLALAPIGANAVTFIAADPWAFGQNSDIDELGEALDSSGPTQCEEVVVCNALGTGGDIVYVGYSSSALTYGAGSTLATAGYPLFPVASSGTTCTPTIKAIKKASGSTTYVNVRHIYVYGNGTNNAASYSCGKFKP